MEEQRPLVRTDLCYGQREAERELHKGRYEDQEFHYNLAEEHVKICFTQKGFTAQLRHSC